MGLHGGGVELVNAGHPAPLLRDGVVELVELQVDVLFGVVPHQYRVQRLDLRLGTGWCCSPTACSNATPPWTWPLKKMFSAFAATGHARKR
ncbi:hypothetical protein ABZ345_36480 [Lentzea sp. NPDC005914]|uniref:hypothetical protein n=1 Tax=Lentzea sp. NPDC005914 TaxID=3154572 RepID=UPI003405BBCF